MFLVDNATSMIPFWSEVEDLLHNLAYAVEKFDHNGLDLCYTHSGEKIRSANLTELVNSVRKHKPPCAAGNDVRCTDIETNLGRYLDEYRERIEKYENRKISRHLHHEVKRMKIYVLSDGRWQPESYGAIGETLWQLVSTLRRHGRNPKQIGVQFIQFGDDPDARRCLQWLDNGLGFGDYDIVDTEPSVGNGLKMLVGAIKKRADRANENPSPSTPDDPRSPGVLLASRSTLDEYAPRPSCGVHYCYQSDPPNAHIRHSSQTSNGLSSTTSPTSLHANRF